MRKFLWILLGFICLIIAAAIIIPFFVSLNDLREPIAQKASKAIGRPVFIKGDIALSLLPSPAVKIADLGIANIPDGKAPHFLLVKSLRAKVSLWPLIKRQIKIESIDIESPEIFLEKLGENINNWSFARAPQEDNEPSKFDLALDKVVVKSGQLKYTDENQVYELKNLDLSVALASLQGPFVIDGSLEAYGHNLKIDARIAKLIDPVKISLKLDVDKHATIKADFSWLKTKNQMSGLLDMNANLELIKSFKADLEIPAGLKKNIKLISDFNFLDSNLELKNLKLELAQAKAHGHISANWAHALKIDGNIQDLPGKGAVNWTLIKRDGRFNGNLKADVANLKTLLTWLEIDSKKIPAGVTNNISLSTNYSIGEPIRLSNLDFKLADARVQGDLSFQKKGKLNDVWLDLKTPHLEKLLQKFAKKSDKALGPAKITGTLIGDQKKLDVDVAVNLGFTDVKAKGTALKLDDNPDFNINLNAKSSNLNIALESFGIAIPHRFGATTIAAHIVGSAKNLKITQLDASFSPNLLIKGDVHIDQTGLKPKISAQLVSSVLDLKALLPSLPKSSAQATQEQWSKEAINLNFLNKFDAQVSLFAPKIIREDIIITNPKINAKIHNGVIDINPLSGLIFGGDFRIISQVNSENNFRVAATLNNAQIPNLMAQDSQFKIIRGKLSFNSDVAGHGKNMFEIISSLKGLISFSSKDGVINGIDLEALSDRIARLKDANSVLALVETALARGKTPYSTYNGNIMLSNGIATISDMRLITSVATASASGSIDLPRYRLNVGVELSLSNQPTWPPIGLRLTGLINNPSRQIDVSKLISFLIQNVFKNLIEKHINIPKTPEDVFNILRR